MDAFLFDGCQSPKTRRDWSLNERTVTFLPMLCSALFFPFSSSWKRKKTFRKKCIRPGYKSILLGTTIHFFADYQHLFFLCIPLLQKSFVSFLRWISIRRKLSKIPLEQKRWNIMIHYWVPKAPKVWLEKVNCSRFFLLGLATNLKFVAFLR